MKLVTYRVGGSWLAGWLEGEFVWSVAAAQEWVRRQRPGLRRELPVTVGELIARPTPMLVAAVTELRGLIGAERPAGVVTPLREVTLSAPLRTPRTIRDFYAFEAHVSTARARRGLGMIPEWYDFPVFYFTNPNAVAGPGEVVCGPRHCTQLDYELEVAVVIGAPCMNISAEQADDCIAGYMIMNDWSARDLQRTEMKVGLGPAKGKDFATSFGPWLVTPDELADRRQGDRYDLRMTAAINGREVSRGNLADLHFTFGQMIERASRDCMLYPGEVIGSGTVGTGCLLETEASDWLRPGDTVELCVERLGRLTNVIGDPETTGKG